MERQALRETVVATLRGIAPEVVDSELASERPLRQRKDDIPLLAQHFLARYGDENRKPAMELTPDALDLLTAYDWPGNVRELENVIERAVVLSQGPQIVAKSAMTLKP